MKLRFSILTLMLLMILSAALGQATAPVKDSCPKIEIFGPPAVIQPGETMQFKIEIEDPEKYEFEWTVDKGSIISGEGHSRIVVGGTQDFDLETVTATVVIKGLPLECRDIYEETGLVVVIGDPVLFDEFGKLQRDDIRARIDNLLISLQGSPNTVGLLQTYGKPNEVSRRHRLIRAHMLHRNYEMSRIILKNGGAESNIRTRIWIVPKGVDTEYFY